MLIVIALIIVGALIGFVLGWLAREEKTRRDWRSLTHGPSVSLDGKSVRGSKVGVIPGQGVMQNVDGELVYYPFQTGGSDDTDA